MIVTDSVNLRELVLAILLSVTRDGEYSHIVISDVLGKYQYLTKKERAFVTRVAEGTLEHMIELDYIIDCFSKVKVKKMKPVIRCILRSSVYELCYMDAIPPSATCNEAVKLARKKGFASLTGFVNGVLRNIGRNLSAIRYPDETAEPVRSLSVRYSMPEWIVELWMKEYGSAQTKEILAAFLKEAQLSIRANLTKTTPGKLKEILESEGLEVAPDDELPYAFYISGIDYLQSLESFSDGLFYVQDISSMKVAETAEPRQGDYVIDVCAAPGGKSIQLAELLAGTGRVKACDLTEYKVGLIEENIRRCGLTNIEAVQRDATVFDEEDKEQADIVIADLPCSGLGVLRKKKDIRYRMTPAQAEELAALQKKMLQVVCRYVKPGGTLMYSTCTIHKAENEDNVNWFLEKQPEFTLVSMEQILPTQGNCDGFFIAKLRKKYE